MLSPNWTTVKQPGGFTNHRTVVDVCTHCDVVLLSSFYWERPCGWSVEGAGTTKCCREAEAAQHDSMPPPSVSLPLCIYSNHCWMCCDSTKKLISRFEIENTLFHRSDSWLMFSGKDFDLSVNSSEGSWTGLCDWALIVRTQETLLIWHASN